MPKWLRFYYCYLLFNFAPKLARSNLVNSFKGCIQQAASPLSARYRAVLLLQRCVVDTRLVGKPALYPRPEGRNFTAHLIRSVCFSQHLDLITRKKSNREYIVTTLGLKEMMQGTLICKLCIYTTANPTRQAVFECGRLVRSINILKYLRTPQLERNIRRTQNRIETYHQLCATAAKVG